MFNLIHKILPDTAMLRRYVNSSRERVMFVLDSSGSMSSKDYKPSRILALKEAVKQFIQHRIAIDNKDEVGIVTFGSIAHVIFLPCALEYCRDQVLEKVGAIKTGFSTNIVDGLAKANEILLKASLLSHATERIVLLSDGGHNDGGDPVRVADELKNRGIIIECIGIGAKGDRGLHEDMLKEIASTLNGKLLYRWIGDSGELQKHFIEISSKLVVNRKT